MFFDVIGYVYLKGKKLGHRRVKDGEVTYKKFEVGQLMGSIQLGIQNSVGNLNTEVSLT